MADIIIRGMEMPKCCALCDLEHWDEDSYGDEMNHRCAIFYKGYTAKVRETGRLTDCPLVPLPAGHGRLIDAERFRVILCRLKERQNDDVAIHALNWAIECLDKLDTIVPVEGDGEDV